MFIQQLSPHVADLIAAGEVVERPSSVVKELIENAIDAHSSAVIVEIQRGGMASIRVTDNGRGIAPSELPTAFLRHATSKLREAEDLAAIGTLGFRGEALAAIAAVSRIDIFSREKGAAEGASLSLEGGVPGEVECAGCPEGTTIVVRDLFFNTPARLKFMKSDSAEAAAVAALLQQIALSHPEVSIKYIRDGKEELHTPGDNKLLSAIYAARGRDFAKSLTAVDGGGEGIRVRGFVTEPLAGRGSRAMQTFFCCGRMIKSALLTAALEEAYQNRQMKGKFPGCVLHIDLPLSAVDVNVHPAKTVVKFANERAVFSAVHHTVADALDGRAKAAAPAPTPTAQAAPKTDFYRTMDAKTFREEQAKASPRPAAPVRPPVITSPEMGGRTVLRDSGRIIPSAPTTTHRETEKPVAVLQPGLDKDGSSLPLTREVAKSKILTKGETEKHELQMYLSPSRSFVAPAPSSEGAETGLTEQHWEKTPVIPVSIPRAEPAPVEIPLPEEKQIAVETPAEIEQITMESEAVTPWRYIGEVLHTYIIAEEGDDVWLIDKHAAHERINFDRMKASQEPFMRQQLLASLAVDLSREQYAVLLENLPLLEEFGFEAEDFGDGALLLRAIPADLTTGQARDTLEELAEKLLTCRGADPSLARDEMLHTMACKASIKGGWESDERELKALLSKVQSGEVQFCPHGRPVKVKLTKYEIEKMFKRA